MHLKLIPFFYLGLRRVQVFSRCRVLKVDVLCYQFQSPEGSMFHDDQPYPVIFRYVVLLVNSSH